MIKNDIVIYGNDFNKVQLPEFNSLEHDLLCIILSNIKDKEAGADIELTYDDLIQTIRNNFDSATERAETQEKSIDLASAAYGNMIKDTAEQPVKKQQRPKQYKLLKSHEDFTKVIESLKLKIFKADFTIIRELKDEIEVATWNLFKTMRIYYRKRNPDDGHDTSKLFNRIVLSIHEEFEYLIKNLSGNFTQYELKEFISISNKDKYAKAIYKLLKQYKDTGIYIDSWSEFLRKIGAPESYYQPNRVGDVRKRILNPAMLELTSEKILFGQCVTPFKNLKFETIRVPGSRGRGGKISKIKFTFVKESEQKKEQK